MNAQAQFLAWLRTTYPPIYQLALTHALQTNGVTREQLLRESGLGELGYHWSEAGGVPYSYAEGGNEPYTAAGYGNYVEQAETGNNPYTGAGYGDTGVQYESVGAGGYRAGMQTVNGLAYPQLGDNGDGSLDLQPISMPGDLSTVSTDQIDLSSVADNLPSFDTSTTPATSSPSINWSNVLTSVIQGASNIGASILGTNTSANALLQTNAARVAAGLSPLNTNGSPMSLAQMQAAGYTSSQITAIENALSGQTGLSAPFLGLPLWMWGLIGGGALLFFARRRRA